MYGPKPLIEEHYHIAELISAQERRAYDREYHRNKAKTASERMDDIKEAKAREIKPFWCWRCSLDFFAETIKQVEKDWSCLTQYVAFYKAKCPKGHWCMRLITDKGRDGYWVRSRRVVADRGLHYADTIQPHETGFNLLYKKI